MTLALVCLAVVAARVHAAGIEFDKVLNEVEAAPDAKLVVSDFPFTNKGKQTSVISKCDPICSCLKVEVSGGKLRYEPGESGVVRVTLDMGNFSGTVDKTTPLFIDDDAPDKPSKNLTVRVHIPVLVELEPKTVKWEIGGAATPQVIHVTMKGEKPIQIVGVTSTSENFKYEVKTIAQGSKYDIVVTPVSVETGNLGRLRVETDCPIQKHRIQQAFATVYKAADREPAAKP